MTQSELNEQGPVTPSKGGHPPGGVVRCLTCGFATDAHGVDPLEAVGSVAPHHEVYHHLVATAVNYRTGWGPNKDQPHPLYKEEVGHGQDT